MVLLAGGIFGAAAYANDAAEPAPVVVVEPTLEAEKEAAPVVVTPEPEPVVTPEPEPVVVPEPAPEVVVPEPEPVVVPEPAPAAPERAPEPVPAPANPGGGHNLDVPGGGGGDTTGPLGG